MIKYATPHVFGIFSRNTVTSSVVSQLSSIHRVANMREKPILLNNSSKIRYKNLQFLIEKVKTGGLNQPN